MKSHEVMTVYPSPAPGKVCHAGKVLTPPAGWILVNAGDSGLTRRLKAAGEYWIMVRKRRNRQESVGLWVPRETAERLRAELAAERETAAYQQKLDAGRRARARQQASYELDFRQAVIDFLHFAPRWRPLSEAIAEAVTIHAVPVGSGTVARTSRIPLPRRAEAAVIAWMRHQTTAYDKMVIARQKGRRREVRRQLAATSRQLLQLYRDGRDVEPEACPLAQALASSPAKEAPPAATASVPVRRTPVSATPAEPQPKPRASAPSPVRQRVAGAWKDLFEDE